MEFQSYPKWKYARGASLIVESETEEQALKGDWYDNPGEVPEDEKDDAKAVKDVLIAEAAERSIPVDPRWSIDKLREALQ